MIDIEDYLIGKMIERIDRERLRITSRPEDYEEEVEDLFLETAWEAEEEVDDIKQFRKAYISKYGEDDGMWYDEFWRHAILVGNDYAEKILMAR